jgi:predicted dehydrogenase
MGNQGHSSEHIRLLCEWVWSGAIGPVREVYAWSSRPSGGAAFAVNMKRPAETPPVPEGLDWDLWLGPAAERPYHPAYLPFRWRGWVDFGTGALGDMGCHILDPCFWALKLDEAETVEVEATSTHYDPEKMRETYPDASIVRFQFPARGDMPPLKLTWFDGRLRPPRVPDMGQDRMLGGEGAILVGEQASILHGSHGASGARIIPEPKMKAYLGDPAPKTLPRSAGHHRDWIEACKGGQPASADFRYGGPLTEMALLGTLAIRMQNRVLQWDAKAMKVTNLPEANDLVTPPYREGWVL